MKKRLLYLFLVFVFVSVACQFQIGKPEATEEILPPTEEAPTLAPPPTEPPLEPTDTPEPTQPPEPEATPTEEVSPYYTMDFGGDLSNWSQVVLAGDPSKTYIRQMGNRLKFEVPSPETYVYVENGSFSYQDVYVEAEVETVKSGANGIALWCRGSDKGFYELRIHTVGPQAGTYELFRYDFLLRQQKKVPYVQLLKGIGHVSTYEIKAGIGLNKIGMLCQGQEIRVFINGVEHLINNEPPVKDSTLTEGTIGFGVMSFSQGPVEVDFLSLAVIEP